MSDRRLWERLRRAKYIALALVFIIAGITLLIVSHIDAVKQWDFLPVKDLGNGLFTAGVVGIAIAFIDSRDAEHRTRHYVRAVIEEQAPFLRDTVMAGFAPTPQDLARIANADVIDQIAENSLALRLGNPELARDLCANLGRQVDRSRECRYDTRVSITLTPWPDGPAHGVGSMLVATVTWEYRVTPPPREHRLVCTADEQAYRDASSDPSITDVWRFAPVAGLTPTTSGVFDLVRYAVNGQPQELSQQDQSGARIVTVTPDYGDDTPDSVHVSYVYRTLVQRHGHRLFLDFDRPNHGLHVDFTHHGCGIHTVNVEPFFASFEPPRIYLSPAEAPTPTVTVGFDGWTLPRSGVQFTWTLHSELDSTT